MTKRIKLSIIVSLILMIILFTSQSLLIIDLMGHIEQIGYFGYAVIFSLFPIIGTFLYEHIRKNRAILIENIYSKKLDDVLNSQANNVLFYDGNVTEGAKVLTKEVSETINADRCSIWLFDKERTSITCQQLYIKDENTWYQDIVLYKKDYKEYFFSLLLNPVIIANDAENHKATSCFKESYLKPLGIKSMLDVPITYRGETIGVICIESFTKRDWREIEIKFAQLLSSLYSFAYSVKENTVVSKNIKDIESFVDHSVLVSKADKFGKITYVNKKFEDVSGWSLKETLGKDHNIVNSGFHPKEYWKKMYDTTIKKRKIWNDVVTNKNKNGELYWVDSYIKAEFDPTTDELIGFMSIRYDVTELIKQSQEIEKKNTYLEHAAKILRHDMHSGINTYIPRGISSLERRITKEDIGRLKLESPLKLLKDGLLHAQKVYKGVYEFTNLVKKDVVLNKTECDLKQILEYYLTTTSYKSQVIIDDLLVANVNEPLFCTAIDNLIRNGLKYNDSSTKYVHIYIENGKLVIQDNGRGLTQEEFDILSKPYARKKDQKESGSGLGLNICIAILQEHGFSISCNKNELGTKLTIDLK
jgi:PAS domain S-box-containing protein